MSKGFTLVELLAVFIILGVLIALVFPTVNTILKESKETISSAQQTNILNSTYDYTLKNVKELPEQDEINYITLNELKKEGFIDSDIKDIDTREKYPDHLVISIKNVGTKYENKNKKAVIHGSYLYTIEEDILRRNDYETKKPIITVNNYESSLTKTINLNGKYEEPVFSASSSTGEDLTDNVIKNIIYNSKNSSKVNTRKAGIYYINYTVVDNEGYSSLVTLNIIVSDTELPDLTIPDNITISLSDTSFDLMDGVTCTDNSNECDITIEGEIKFGIPDKYTIEYIAKDPSGNTVTDRRIITVE